MISPTRGKLMDGRTAARRVLDQVAGKARSIQAATGVTPTLAAILVGHDPASATYVHMKRRRCEEAGMKSIAVELPLDTTQDRLIGEIVRLGTDPSIHGILLQHPVPEPLDERAAFESIPPAKDVDGVTSAMAGRLALGMPAYGACTPAGIMHLLREYDVCPSGLRAVVIGRSPILGRPMAFMLLNADATVTVCHSRTRNLPDIVRAADLVVAAVGKPRFVQGSWIKDGAVVIDAGYNEGNLGDVVFDAALPRVSLITPVPGGVGPMTIAMLMKHTADAAATQLGVTA